MLFVFNMSAKVSAQTHFEPKTADLKFGSEVFWTFDTLRSTNWCRTVCWSM